jgi:hypothetical protein
MSFISFALLAEKTCFLLTGAMAMINKVLGGLRFPTASVGCFADPFLICAVSATVEYSVGLYSMADYFTAAMRTLRRHSLNCALKAIKNMRFARCSNLECLVIVIATGFTTCHRYFLLSKLNKIGFHKNDHASNVP